LIRFMPAVRANGVPKESPEKHAFSRFFVNFVRGFASCFAIPD
jgi:hypothetical protein